MKRSPVGLLLPVGRTMLKGLAALLPVLVTAWLLAWAGGSAEALLGGAMRRLLPEDAYVRGMGLAAAAALVYMAGLATELWFVRRLLDAGGSVAERIPLVKTLYGSIRDFLGFFSPGARRRFGRVVLVDVGADALVLGFLTRDRVEELPEGDNGEKRVAVYLPMSYQLGGYTVLVHRDRVRETDMDLEEAMRFALTAGISSRKPDEPAERPPRPKPGLLASLLGGKG